MLMKLIATPLQLFLTAGHLWSHILIYVHGNVTKMIDIIIATSSIHNVTSSCKGAITQLQIQGLWNYRTAQIFDGGKY